MPSLALLFDLPLQETGLGRTARSSIGPLKQCPFLLSASPRPPQETAERRGVPPPSVGLRCGSILNAKTNHVLHSEHSAQESPC